MAALDILYRINYLLTLCSIKRVETGNCQVALGKSGSLKIPHSLGGAGKSYISTPCKILYFTQQSKSYTFCTPCQNLYCTPWKILYGLHSSQNPIHKICTAVLNLYVFDGSKNPIQFTLQPNPLKTFPNFLPVK